VLEWWGSDLKLKLPSMSHLPFTCSHSVNQSVSPAYSVIHPIAHLLDRNENEREDEDKKRTGTSVSYSIASTAIASILMIAGTPSCCVLNICY
jgi:hypothetical protein